ncbi:glutathione S-transferase family protein [Zavarzinia sp. CC-PAN008]|uniref:glutathione S-transferase family protein n=1 Tax=Zavarzinia sp. CC-PAN008 TaxID=3243332 RepID=UPI003F74826A
MLFYDYHDAPNPRVVRMFAAEKGIALPLRPLDLNRGENRKPPYVTEINRTGQVPALQLDDGRVICEILPICEYLEELHPAPALIGATPEDRAEARQWTRWIDLKYVERMTEACVVQAGPIRDLYSRFNYKTMLPPEMWEICMAVAHEKLAWFDAEMAGRTFVCGNRLTLADIHLFVFIDFFEGLGLNFPRALSWVAGHYDRMKARPSAAA